MRIVNDIVKEHLRVSRKFTRELTRDPRKAKRFLIRAGILNKSGTKLANRCKG